MIGVMFHHFHGGAHPKRAGSITGQDLIDMVEHLRKSYNVMSADNWLIGFRCNDLIDRDICLTFDDNLKCQYDIALPALDLLGLKAFFFVYDYGSTRMELHRHIIDTEFADLNYFYTQFYKVAGIDAPSCPDGYLSEYSFYTDEDRQFRYVRNEALGHERYSQVMDNVLLDCNMPTTLRDLLMVADEWKSLHDRGHILGLHSHSHPYGMAGMSIDDQAHEYRENYKNVNAVHCEGITAMSHPYGSYSPSTLSVLEGLCIKVGFDSHPNPHIKSDLALPRIDHAVIMREMQCE